MRGVVRFGSLDPLLDVGVEEVATPTVDEATLVMFEVSSSVCVDASRYCLVSEVAVVLQGAEDSFGKSPVRLKAWPLWSGEGESCESFHRSTQTSRASAADFYRREQLEPIISIQRQLPPADG